MNVKTSMLTLVNPYEQGLLPQDSDARLQGINNSIWLIRERVMKTGRFTVCVSARTQKIIETVKEVVNSWLKEVVFENDLDKEQVMTEYFSYLTPTLDNRFVNICKAAGKAGNNLREISPCSNKPGPKNELCITVNAGIINRGLHYNRDLHEEGPSYLAYLIQGAFYSGGTVIPFNVWSNAFSINNEEKKILLEQTADRNKVINKELENMAIRDAVTTALHCDPGYGL